MAQIKLGLALTDIKGKVGGSVFSSNKNGKYFRNNSVGGGRNSAIWDTKKTILGSVAQRWRLLSHDQREAWNLAATQIPKTNKVGDVVYWSGFNYFSSVNSKRLNLGGSVILLPPALESFPDIQDFSVKLLPQTQFVPRISFSVLKDKPDDERSYLQLLAFDPPAIGEPGPTSVIWLDVDWYELCMSSPNCSYDICTDTYGIDTNITLSVSVVNSLSLVFTIKREDDNSLTNTQDFTIPLSDIATAAAKPLIVIFPGSPKGTLLTSLSSEVFSYDLSTKDDDELNFNGKKIYTNHQDSENTFPLSMVSLYTPVGDTRDTLAVVNGYITESLTAASSLVNFPAGIADNDIASSNGESWQLVKPVNNVVVHTNTRQIVKPVVYIEGLDDLDDGMQYKIEYSPAISKGRTSSITRYRFGQLATHKTYTGFDPGTLLLLDGWANQPVMAPGSALSVRVSIVNQGLDQSSPSVTKETRKGPKFKGGADLPDAVN